MPRKERAQFAGHTLMPQRCREVAYILVILAGRISAGLLLLRLALLRRTKFDNDAETTMRILSVWVFEFIKLLGRRRLHPLNAECPICHRVVRLHYNKAGRRHLFAHARAYSRTLYEGSRYRNHYAARIKCVGSGMLAKFNPRPNESQRFNLPKSLEFEG